MLNRMILLAVAAALLAAPVTADVIVEDVSFDCTGELVRIVDTDAGPRATGLVEITIDLPDGSEWRSSGVVVIAVPEQAAGRDVEGRRINRCRGEAAMFAEVVENIGGVDIWSVRLDPNRIRLRIGNWRLTDPTQVGFGSSASGSPNI
jgi:hypothetical protein